MPGGIIAVSSDAAATTAFLARTTGLDATHTNAYKALINGLVSDGVWAKLDVLHVYATQDSTTALLNLVSTNYNGVSHGAPTFAADRGFTGVAASATVYIDSQFVASSASSPQFVRDSAHISVWNLTNGTTNDYIVGADGAAFIGIMPKYIDGFAYYYTNGAQVTSISNSDPRGMTLANRSTSSASQLYKNGSSISTTGANSSTGLPNQAIHSLGYMNAGAAHVGAADQEAMISIGSSLDATQAGNFYTRLRTYMTAVGVP